MKIDTIMFKYSIIFSWCSQHRGYTTVLQSCFWAHEYSHSEIS